MYVMAPKRSGELVAAKRARVWHLYQGGKSYGATAASIGCHDIMKQLLRQPLAPLEGPLAGEAEQSGLVPTNINNVVIQTTTRPTSVWFAVWKVFGWESGRSS